VNSSKAHKPLHSSDVRVFLRHSESVDRSVSRDWYTAAIGVAFCSNCVHLNSAKNGVSYRISTSSRLLPRTSKAISATLIMAESSFGIGILGAASIAKKNARAIAKCRNGTGGRTGPMQQRPQLCALLVFMYELDVRPVCKCTTGRQAVSILPTLSPCFYNACTALGIELTAL